jgi:hypothetical protein
MTEQQLFILSLLLRYMHILGAITLMGGTIFMRFALAPTVLSLEGSTRADVHERVRARWSKFIMLASGLLLVSGITNLALTGNYDFGPVFGLPKGYQMVVGIKFLLALPIFLFASFLAGRSATAKKFQANAPFWMNVNLTLALLMVLIGGYLRFTPRTYKTGPAGATSAVTSLETVNQNLPLRQSAE